MLSVAVELVRQIGVIVASGFAAWAGRVTIPACPACPRGGDLVCAACPSLACPACSCSAPAPAPLPERCPLCQECPAAEACAAAPASWPFAGFFFGVLVGIGLALLVLGPFLCRRPGTHLALEDAGEGEERGAVEEYVHEPRRVGPRLRGVFR